MRLKKTFWLVVVAALFILGIGSWIAISVIQANTIQQFKIQTKKVPLVPPHPHNPSQDSIEDDGHHILVRSDEFIVPEDIWIKGFDAKVLNAYGPLIHHLYLGRTDKHDSLCRNYPWQALFVTSEVNMGPQMFLGNFGMFIPKGTPLKIFSMLHNPTPPLGPGKTFKDVSMEVTVFYERNSLIKRHIPIEYHRLHLSDNPCTNVERGEVFSVPPNSKKYTKGNSVSKEGVSTSSYTFSQKGTIIGMGGHDHPFEGGQGVNVFKNQDFLGSFKSVPTGHGNWVSWNIPIFAGAIRIKPKDVISITVDYENPNKFPVRGAMGMLVFYFAKD